MILLNTLQNFLQSLAAPIHLVIGYSGGMDSHVLLHALKQLQSTQDFSMRAIHLNHGLNPNAQQWQQHTQQVCQELQIPFITHDLNLQIPKGESIENAARAARYRYFHEALKSGELLCTAHHQEDQLETVLLQLLRGAGPKGLAAMPILQNNHARPLLHINHDLILAYAQTNHLNWIHDDSNLNTQFDRNFLRQELIPILKKRFPQAAQTISRSAQHCASTQQVLDQYLNQELCHLTGDFENTLSRKKLLTFDENLQRHLLRAWLAKQNMVMPNTEQLLQIQKLLTLKNDVKAVVTWQHYSAKLYRDNLFAQPTAWFSPHHRPSIESIQLIHSPDGKLSPDILKKQITIRFRETSDTHLKKIFQTCHIPPWQRWQLPLLFVDNELAAIANVYIAPKFSCEAGMLFAFNDS